MIGQNREELKTSNILKWHKQGYLGEGITIAVLDDEGAPHDYMDYAIAPFDDLQGIGHSCNVAKVIHEVAPLAKIVMLNYIGKRCNKEQVINWIRVNKDNIDIINCSFTSSKDDIFGLENLDIPVACAAGNSNSDRVSLPARYDFTIAVGAWIESIEKLASYSNQGVKLDCVDFTDIYIPNSKREYFYFNGTSCASPMTSGKLGLIAEAFKQKEKRLTRKIAREIINDNTIDKYEQGFDEKTGHGLFILPDLDKIEKYLLREGEEMNKPEKIIIHHSLTKDGDDLKDYNAIKHYHVETNGWRNIGYHWVLEKVAYRYHWIPGRDEKESGAHCKEQNINSRSVGICVVGNFDKDVPNDEIYKLVARKCKELIKKYNLTLDDIEPHNKYATYKSCPGKNFDVENVKKMIEKEESFVGKKVAREIPILLNGRELEEKAIVIEMENGGHSFAHLRSVFEALGFTVGYDGRVLLNKEE